MIIDEVGFLFQGFTPLAINRRPSRAKYMNYEVGFLFQAFTRLAINRRPSGAKCDEPFAGEIPAAPPGLNAMNRLPAKFQAFTRLAIDRRPSGAKCDEPFAGEIPGVYTPGY
jgi:hypothetical protein